MGDIDEIRQSLERRRGELLLATRELAMVEDALRALDGPARPVRGSLKERAVAIVAASPGLRASDIARQAGTSSANIQRPLKALVQEGRLQRDAAKRWSVAPN